MTSATGELRELGAGEARLAHAAMLALRPGLGDAAAFTATVDAVQRPEGYRLVACFEPGNEGAAAVAGFRIAHHLAWGRSLYVDDLSTLPGARGRGHAGRLLAWLRVEALRCGCDELHLDSGVGPLRADAHRLYLNSGLQITSHHFSAGLGDG